MNATTVDLRYRTREVLKSLDRGETVIVTFRGKTRGIMTPPRAESSIRGRPMKVVDHPFFGSTAESSESVDAIVNRLRGGRYS